MCWCWRTSEPTLRAVEYGWVITGAAVLRIFAITGLDDVIPHFASLEEALAATSGSTEGS